LSSSDILIVLIGASLVTERGTEILMRASGTVLSNSQSREMLDGGGGGNHFYFIDARGTDGVLTEQRTSRFSRNT
jgi:hypothetical protein